MVSLVIFLGWVRLSFPLNKFLEGWVSWGALGTSNHLRYWFCIWELFALVWRCMTYLGWLCTSFQCVHLSMTRWCLALFILSSPALTNSPIFFCLLNCCITPYTIDIIIYTLIVFLFLWEDFCYLSFHSCILSLPNSDPKLNNYSQYYVSSNVKI